jgi:alpha/beta superfamily hydrolase
MASVLDKNPAQFSPGEAHFLIDGPQGDLECLSLSAKGPSKGLAVVCHPHPLYQGTMHNKVVHTLAKAFHQQHLHVIRFNYRGVGRSEGEFGDSIGEVADLMAVLSWAKQVLGETPLWLAGFSFGCYIAAMGATQRKCQQLISVAPAVNHQPYSELKDPQCPWLVIQGEEDEVVPPQEVYTWYEQAKTQYQDIKLIKVPQGSHFFHGGLITLRALVEDNFVNPPL